MNAFFSSRRGRRGGFLLLEIILATAIFTIGVLSLGRCLSSCLTQQRIRSQEERARIALENRMAEIQASPAVPEDARATHLKGMFQGLTLTERRRSVDIKNENNVSLNDLHEVTLSVEWEGPGGERLTRSISFNLLRGRG